ncbi:MAG: hypothetical protein NC392_06345 [Roseburia sp.]|nr:hypothetical protein [Roseburia sp.]MCM1202083.1 hypothetical protein [Bacteroides fragilis]
MYKRKMKENQILSKMKSAREEWVKTIDKKPLRALIAPAITVILILLNRQTVYSGMSKIEMNLILLIVFLIELLVAIANQKNTTKLFWLVGTIAVCSEIIFYNFVEEGWKLTLTSIHEVINGFCGIWIGVSALIFVYLAVVCVRVIRWTQADWEKVKEIRREYRKTWLEKYVELRGVINRYKIEQREQRALLRKQNIDEKIKQREHVRKIRAEKRESELQEQEEQNQHNFEMNQRRRALEKEHQEKTDKIQHDRKETKLESENEIERLRYQRKIAAKQNQQPVLKPEIDKLFEKLLKIAKILVPIVITALIILGYIKMPMSEETHGINEWIRQTGQFMEAFQNVDKEEMEASQNAGENEEEMEASQNAGENEEEMEASQNAGEDEEEIEASQNAGEDEEEIEASQNTDEGKNENNGLGTFEALTEYTIFYIALIGTAISVVFLIWKTVESVCSWMLKGKPSYTGFSGFFSEYSTPFVILIIAVSVLLTLVDAGTIMTNLPQLFTTLAGTILCIMLTLIAVDVIRLIIDQSIRPGSLLRTAMHLTFVLFIENVMGIVIGVLAGVNLKAAITSLLSFFWHRENEDLYQNMEKAMNDALNEEIDRARQSRKRGSKFSRSLKHWHRRKTQ